MESITHVLRQYPIVARIGALADQLQVEMYLVGGFVRDLFLGRVSHDMDIVCIGSGIQVAQAVAQAIGPNTQVTCFKNFGTAMVQWDGWTLEFVGARRESYRHTSRKPTVVPATLAEDQGRRDFTINTMAISLNKACFGLLLDPFSGRHDLARKVIQTPGDPIQTFSEDPLRMMRAIRFATQLALTIAPVTLQAIEQQVDRIHIVATERITEELQKILACSTPSAGFLLLLQTGLLKRIFPELVALQGKEVMQGHSHKDNFYHTLQVVDQVAQHTNCLWLRWAALLHDIAKPRTKRFDPTVGFTFHSHEEVGARMVPAIFRRLKLPLHDKMAYVQKLVRLHLRPIALVQAVTDTAVRRLLYEAGNDLEDLMLLCRADITSKNPEKVRRYLQNFDAVAVKIKQVEEKDQIRNFQPVITGTIIMKTFQLSPSRIVGEIKEAIKEAILEGELANEYAAAYDYMLLLGKARGLVVGGD